MAVGPVILSVAGDAFVLPAKVEAFVWEGATTAGDTVQIKGRAGSQETLLWPGRASGSHTYLGISWRTGLSCPDGFRLAQISAGRVLAYLREE